jgi:hypothetical protein
MGKYKCTTERQWEMDLQRWEGIVIDPEGKVFHTGYLRVTKKDALQDAKRLAEELQNGVTGR